jgi:hypothetical protein
MQSPDYTQKRSLRREKILAYLLLYLFMALTSIPFFVGNEYLIVFFAVSLMLFVFRGYIMDNFIVYYCLIYLLIFAVQSFFFSVLEINIIFGYLLRILYAYCTIRLIGKDIAKYFVNIIYFFTVISLILFLPALVFPDVVNNALEQVAEYIKPLQLHEPGRKHILIYTFGLEYFSDDGLVSSSIPRNSGPFWEPGGFGVFLILAIVFELVENRKFFTKKNTVMFIGVITTLSTGAFIAMFFLVVFYLITYRTPVRIISLVLFVAASVFIYANTFFLREKVTGHLASSSDISLANAPRTRFVSAQLDLIDFFNNPVLGRGRFVQTRFDVKEPDDEILLNHRTNSTTNMLVEFGLFGFVAFFLYMFRSFRAFCILHQFKPVFAFYTVIIVITLGFYEMILIKPFFIGLSFMFLAAIREQARPAIYNPHYLKPAGVSDKQ